MNRKKLVPAGIVLITLLVAVVGIVFSVTYLTKPTWQWGTGNAFFRFDGRAVFAEVAAEPPQSVYGSKIHVWVYRDNKGNLSEVLITGHAASKVCAQASVQLYETAIQLNMDGGDLLGAGIGHFLGLSPDKHRSLLEDSFVQKYINLLMSGENVNEMRAQLEELEQHDPVKQFLRPKKLEELISSLQRLEAETGLVQVSELNSSLSETTRAEVERQVELHHKLLDNGVSIVQIGGDDDPKHAVLLPFYYVTPSQVDVHQSHLVIELNAAELGIPQAVLAAHLSSVVAKMKDETKRRQEFAQKRLQEAKDLKQRFEDDIQAGLRSEDDLITITHTIDWEKLRVIPLPKPQQIRLGDYLSTVLPMIIESAQEQLELAESLLAKIEEAAKPRGRLAELNRAIIIDSFLRDWDLVFLDREQAEAYDAWRRDQRGHVWREIDQLLRRHGVNPDVIKQENVVFQVEIQGDKVKIIPYFVAGRDLFLIIDAHNGIVRYLDPWTLRKMVIQPERELPTEVREKLRRKGTWAEARQLLAAPLLSKAGGLLESGKVEGVKDTLTQALVLDPRDTAAWLIAQYRALQVNTEKEFLKAQAEYSNSDIAFLDLFQKGYERLGSKRYDEAAQFFQKAYELRPAIPDPLIGLALTYHELGDEDKSDYWYKKAQQADHSFVQRFVSEFRQGKLLVSQQFEDLKVHVKNLPSDTRRQLEVIKHIRTGDEHWRKHEYVQALWEYIGALKLNTEFNEPYQKVIDVYWELGMYRRALEAAFLRLSDPIFGLELEAKPLRISSPNMKWGILSKANQGVEKLSVQTGASTLTIMVNDEPVLKLESSSEKEIAYIAKFFRGVTAEQISPIGDTPAERLLNTEIPPLPEQRMWAEDVFFAKGVKDLVLKAMVYGGVAPSFLAPSKVKAIMSYSPEKTALLGTRRDSIWETRDIVVRMDYPRDPMVMAALEENLTDYYTALGRQVVSVKVSSDKEDFRLYAPRTKWEVLREKFTGRTAPPEPNVTMALPRDLSAEFTARLIEGSLIQNLSPAARQALLRDARALHKLDARTSFTQYPQITILKVIVEDKTVYLLVQGEGDAVQVEEMGPKVAKLIDSIKQRMKEHPVPPEGYSTDYARYVVEQLLNKAERQMIRDQLVLPIVQHLSPRVEGDHIILDLRGKPFALRDLPAGPVLRTLIPYFLRGSRLFYVAESSTARKIEAKLQALVDHTKLKFFVSLPAQFIGTPVEELWKAEITKLKRHITDRRLGIILEDLTDDNPVTAKRRVQEALEEKGSLVFVFGHHPGTGDLEIGSGGTFTREDLEHLETRFEPERFVAFVGCRGDALAWPDRVVKKLGVLSFSFFEPFDANELLGFLNAIVEELGKDPDARPQAVPFFFHIMEKLDLKKGGPVGQMPSEEGNT